MNRQMWGSKIHRADILEHELESYETVVVHVNSNNEIIDVNSNVDLLEVAS